MLAVCGAFCFLTSTFGAVFLAVLGILVKHDYRYVGEWYDHEEQEDHLPTETMKHNASSALFATAGVYAAFIILSLICLAVGKAKK